MPVDILVKLSPDGAGLIPVDSLQLESLSDLRHGVVYKATCTAPRDSRKHRRAMALFRVCYGLWQPPTVEHLGVPVAKDFESFREHLTIAAGYYKATYLVKGGVRLRAKSISYASMDQVDFDRFYSAVINAALEHVGGMTGMPAEKVREMVDAIMRFD